LFIKTVGVKKGNAATNSGKLKNPSFV